MQPVHDNWLYATFDALWSLVSPTNRKRIYFMLPSRVPPCWKKHYLECKSLTWNGLRAYKPAPSATVTKSSKDSQVLTATVMSTVWSPPFFAQPLGDKLPPGTGLSSRLARAEPGCFERTRLQRCVQTLGGSTPCSWCVLVRKVFRRVEASNRSKTAENPPQHTSLLHV